MWQAVLGLVVITFFAWIVSENRRAVEWKRVIAGLALQFAIALLFFKIPFLTEALLSLNAIVQVIEKATAAGATFMFGYLSGGKPPFALTDAGANFIVAFRVLPIVLVVSALSAVLFHWGIMQWLVGLFSRLLRRTLKISGPVGIGVAANVYLGIVEAPLFVKPYLAKMSRSALFVVMSAGMATVAGTVMVLYASILNPIVPGAIGHILIASLISAPAVIILAQLMVPEEGAAALDDSVLEVEITTESALDALVKGTVDGIGLLLNIVAMIVVLFAVVNLFDQLLAFLPTAEKLTVEGILGYLLRPLVWLMGVPAAEVAVASDLMGTKVALNEFVSYSRMAALAPEALSLKTRMILTYAMCGFANFASVGLIVGAMGTMIPERRAEVVGLGFKSLLAGLLATCMTGAVVGILL